MKKIGKNNKLIKKEAVEIIGVIIIATLLVTSISVAIVPSIKAGEPFPPKTLYGNVSYCNGGNAIGASVVVSASGYPDETDTTDSSGFYSVDIGPDTGSEWPDGTFFTVTATLGSWSGSNTGTVSGSVTLCDVILQPPTLIATASANPTTIVAGEDVDFTGSASGGATPYSWSWDFDGAGSSTQQNPSNTFNTQGIYNCELTVTDDCSNTDTDIVTITVNPALSCDAGGPYSGSICSAVQFDGSANGGHGGNTFSWTFGDGDSGSGENPSHQYDDDGIYTATMTVTDSEGDICSDTATVSISTSAVVAEAGGPYSGTICESVNFAASASGGCSPYTYSWTFGDGDSGSGQFPSHQYDDDGIYTATVTVTDDSGQTDDDTATVTISTANLVADAGGPYEGKVGNAIDFSGSASGGCQPYSYSWDFGDSGSGIGQNPSHTYQDEGIFTVELTVTDDKGAVDTDTTTVTVNSAEVIADAGGPYFGEVDAPIQFFGNAYEGAPPYDYLWNFGDGETSTEKSPTHIYSEASPPGGYEVVLTVSDSQGNDDWDSTYAIVSEDIEDPTANAGGPYTGIIDENVDFTGSAFGGTPPYSYSWDFDDSDGIGEDSTEQNPSYIYDSKGTYTVTLTVTDDDGKTATDTTTATIQEETPPEDTTPPTVEITSPTGGLYLGGNKILSLGIPIIIGPIDIKVNATDDDSGMNRVEFYIDDTLEETIISKPYTWAWDQTLFFKHTIKVIAYDNADNSESVELSIWKFF